MIPFHAGASAVGDAVTEGQEAVCEVNVLKLHIRELTAEDVYKRQRVDRLDGVEVSFTGIFNTLVVRHQDVAGELSRILNELSVSGVNIANMSLNRDRRGGAALTVVETDQKIPADALELSLIHI